MIIGVLYEKTYNMKTELSEKVKELRKKYHLTQEQLAFNSGISLFSIRELEQGKTSMRMDKVNQILGLFNYELQARPKHESES